jgi:hypothetical protein
VSPSIKLRIQLPFTAETARATTTSAAQIRLTTGLGHSRTTPTSSEWPEIGAPHQGRGIANRLPSFGMIIRLVDSPRDLCLRHGRKVVRVEYREGAGVGAGGPAIGSGSGAAPPPPSDQPPVPVRTADFSVEALGVDPLFLSSLLTPITLLRARPTATHEDQKPGQDCQRRRCAESDARAGRKVGRNKDTKTGRYSADGTTIPRVFALLHRWI